MLLNKPKPIAPPAAGPSAAELYAAYLSNPGAVSANLESAALRAQQKAVDRAQRMSRRSTVQQGAASAAGTVPGLLIYRGAVRG